MSTQNATVLPPAVADRLHGVAAAQQLGEFRRIVPVNEDETVVASIFAAVASAAVGVAGIGALWFIYHSDTVNRVPVMLYLVPLALLATPFFVGQAIGRARRGGRFVGVWDHAVVATSSRQQRIDIVRFDRGAITTSVTLEGDAGKQADVAEVVCSQDDQRVTFSAKTDRAWVEMNDLRVRFGQPPIVRRKEPGYQGE